MLHLLGLESTVDVYKLGDYFSISISLCEPLRIDSTSANRIHVTGKEIEYD